MLKGMLFLEVSICDRSLLRIRYFVPFVLPRMVDEKSAVPHHNRLSMDPNTV